MCTWWTTKQVVIFKVNKHLKLCHEPSVMRWRRSLEVYRTLCKCGRHWRQRLFTVFTVEEEISGACAVMMFKAFVCRIKGKHKHADWKMISINPVSLLCTIKQQYNQQKCSGLMLHKATGQWPRSQAQCNGCNLQVNLIYLYSTSITHAQC